MTIKGLEHSAYYLYNPIWIDVSDINNYLHLSVNIQGVDYPFSMTPRLGSVRFDIAKIVLGLVSEIRNKESIEVIGGSWIVDGSYTVKLSFTDILRFSIQERTQATIIYKTFILGGIDKYASNVPVGNTLSLGVNKWADYPSFHFKLTTGLIVGSQVNDINRRKRLDCTNAYIIFRNGLGGFSSYLFEDYNVEDKGKDLGYYVTDRNIIDSGTELTKSITLRTKLKREDYITAKHLIRSQEVYLYEDNKLTRLVGASSISINDKLSVQDFEINFNIPINYSAQW